MMRLHHVAIWASDLDEAAAFWAEYFGASIGELYESKRQQGFRSRFAHLGDNLRIELMSKPGLLPAGEHFGWAHIALSVGSGAAVDLVAAQFARDGRLLLGARTTGDGYYEAVVLGPDDLHIEITA